jgi:hypothetical protein
MNEVDPENIQDACKSWGLEQVRARLLTGDLPQHWREGALRWLQEAEDEERRYRENMEQTMFRQQMAEAKSATRAGWVAAGAGIAAAVLAAIGIVVTMHH